MIPPFDITKPRDATQDAALAILVLQRFIDGEPFTPGDAGKVIAAIEGLYADRASTERYALGLVTEEAGELLQLVGKALRFGLDAPGPEGEPYRGRSARQMLPVEAGDVSAAMNFAELAQVWDSEDAATRLQLKLKRLLDPEAKDAQGNRLAPDLGARATMFLQAFEAQR